MTQYIISFIVAYMIIGLIPDFIIVLLFTFIVQGYIGKG